MQNKIIGHFNFATDIAACIKNTYIFMHFVGYFCIIELKMHCILIRSDDWLAIIL